MSELLRLNLGANDKLIPGYLSVDIAPPADVIADLNKDWPWEDSTVDAVEAHSVFEHLADIRHTMNELWRVLVPGGKADITVPDATDGHGGICDFTHCSYWCSSTFEYFEKGNYARERFRGSLYYGVKADFRVTMLPPMRSQRKFGGYVMEIRVVLEAIK